MGKGWGLDWLHSVSGLEDGQAVFERLALASRTLGFEYCSYGIQAPLPVTRPRIKLFSNYPPAWRQRYQEAGYLALDPIARHGRRSQLPVLWDDALFHDTPLFWEEARDIGLRVGWGQSSIDRQGFVGMLNLARGGRPISAAELVAKELRMRWLVNVAQVAMSRVHFREWRLRTDDIELTRRECEVLEWAADGKSSSEIAEILGLANETVKFHTKNAIRKLGAGNRTAAVTRALVLGLLAP